MLSVEIEPVLRRLWVGVGKNRLCRAFGNADAAVDAFVGMNDQHVLALVEAVHGAHLDTVRKFAFDAVFGNDESHFRAAL